MRVFRKSVGVRGFQATCITAGARTSWEAGKKRLMEDTARESNLTEVVDLKKENGYLKQLVAEMPLKNRVRKSLNGTDSEDIDI
ncbi:MAG: hypothetical protein G3M70_11705 [Candidatus Nitronauta litoralis]|uniref:Uncharacterized protein n=1 Tax=Candidatus Nitronauta litoralis TaxID=2705533 RepID=A0A7T0BXV8_9BACT|nr:MAG: hypothetical protein G3M70_11705 [Candidatus Nitronauta litoralis]